MVHFFSPLPIRPRGRSQSVVVSRHGVPWTAGPLWLVAALAPGLVTALAIPAAPALGQSDDFTVEQHFSVERPADLSAADAMVIYEKVRDRMVAGYRLSHDAAAETFVDWRKFNSAPYRSATHGQRYVNNYGNTLAKAYGAYEEVPPLPVGSILAKDSFAVTQRGDVFTGPLFLMEKMPAGFRPDAHDWRYTMIMPDGSLFGTTNGEGSERVEFCITCHEAAGDEQQQLFFIPREYRVEFLTLD